MPIHKLSRTNYMVYTVILIGGWSETEVVLPQQVIDDLERVGSEYFAIQGAIDAAIEAQTNARVDGKLEEWEATHGTR